MLPQKFLERMQEMLGDEYEAFYHSLDGDRYQALRLNPLKHPAEVPEGLPVGTFQLTPVSWEKDGYYYTEEDRPGKHPYHEAGAYYIQEPSAMAAAPLLEAAPGERILDLCAAPGGKSTQIAGYLRGEGLLVCNEIHPARAKILSENIERMGVRNACVTNETPERLAEKFGAYFDKILVDAPCSGEGMFRKNETAYAEWSPENVALCAERQDGILDCAAKMLRPGGRLVYSTCTFAPAENEDSVSRFLERHSEFAILPVDKKKLGIPEGVCDGRPAWGSFGEELRGTLRLWPHIVRGEGHFAAVLCKAGERAEGYEPMAAGGLESGIGAKDKRLEMWRSFERECLAADCTKGLWAEGSAGGDGRILSEGIFLCFGENLYLAPKGMPALTGLKVLRPGLHLGTFKKDRFEPSHALALSLAPQDVRHVCGLSAGDERTKAYLNGQTFSYEGEKGWYLIAVDGYSLGWGKLAGGVMKNHYPKGLRKNG